MVSYVPNSSVAVSQQFGLAQTDVFAINDNGQLTVNSVVNAGLWKGGVAIGPTGFGLSGNSLAVSQQFGLTRTDVFLVNIAGQLAVYSVDSGGAWQGPAPMSPIGIAPPGAIVAASQQFGLNQTDVFFIDNNGQLNVAWSYEGRPWGGPGTIGPANIATPGTFLAASQQFGLNRTDVFFVDKTGQLNVCWVDGAGIWQGPLKIGSTGVVPPAFCCVAASQQFGLNQTDVFFIDNHGQLNVCYVDSGGAWKGPATIGPPGIARPGAQIAVCEQAGYTQTDVFFFDTNGQLTLFFTPYVAPYGAPWQGPVRIGPANAGRSGVSLAASRQFNLDQTDVFYVDQSGQLRVYWMFKGKAWNGPNIINQT
jgi:hypothetical protein